MHVKNIIMCEALLISNKIVRLGTRSYQQMMEAMTPDSYSVAQLSRLNRDLELFYEILYNQWDTITEEEYKTFGRQLVVMLQTLKELYLTCKRIGDRNLDKQIELLEMNYSAIYEVNSDIVNFRIKLPKDNGFKKAMEEAGKRINR